MQRKANEVLFLFFFHAAAGICQHETTSKKMRALIKEAECRAGTGKTEIIKCHFI